MNKYQPLSDHLAARADPEWCASFPELEAVLGFPLPKAARTGRAWWANDLGKSHSRAWTAHGWAVGDVDPAAERVMFHRGAEAEAAPVEAPSAAAPQIARAPEELAALAAERPEAWELEDTGQTPASTSRSSGRALGVAALVTASLAVVAGIGAALVRVTLRRR